MNPSLTVLNPKQFHPNLFRRRIPQHARHERPAPESLPVGIHGGALAGAAGDIVVCAQGKSGAGLGFELVGVGGYKGFAAVEDGGGVEGGLEGGVVGGRGGGVGGAGGVGEGG